MTLREILDEIKARHGLDTDYKACKLLQVSQSRISIALKRGSMPDDELILQAEKLLELPEGSLLFEAHATRTKSKDAARLFHEMSKRLLSTAAAVMLSISVTYTAAIEDASAAPAVSERATNVYYVK